MSVKESQIKMLPHSAAKVKLLKLYLDRYLSVLANTAYIPEILLYDLFCGEGTYEGGNGSPIIFLTTIKEVTELNQRNGRQSPKFTCRFNDLDVTKTKKLKRAIEEAGLDKLADVTIQYTNDDYHLALKQTVEEIAKFKSQKAFVFVDPYGYKEIRISDIKSLMSSSKTEVLMFLPTQFMFRFADKGTPECLIEFIDELMPQKEWPKSETGIDFIENLTDAFEKCLGEEAYVDSFIITREKNQYFCLFFFTSHIYGFDRMLDAKWQIDEEDGRGWQYKPEATLFSNVEKRPNTVKFERRLTDFLEESKTCGEVYEFTIHHRHLTKHSGEILAKWQKEGRLTVLKQDGEPARKSSFYLNYDTFNKDPKKVTFKLK